MTIQSIKHGNKEFLIDIDDITKCKKHHWAISYVKLYNSDPYYYVMSTRKSKSVLLHRFIMDAPKGMIVDHIDGNEYDNRKSNLRICTRSENNMNRKLNRNNTSGHKGVAWDKHNNKWMAHIAYQNKSYTLGYFDDINKAIECRDNAEKQIYSEYARPIKYT